MRKDHTYVLGTGLSHDGSACLLKDGKVCVAIEKERISRRKHDGYNDTEAIQYCLEHEGIGLDDLDLVVQSALNLNELAKHNEYFHGQRLFTSEVKVPIISISHHLAHAYSAIGTCPFEGDFDVMVVDGSGSPFNECIDLENCHVPQKELIHPDVSHLYFEKDSYYSCRNGQIQAEIKDFSQASAFYLKNKIERFTVHSIGGMYESMSFYCHKNLMDVGKLMGLGPYGKKAYDQEVFELRDSRVFINQEWYKFLTTPVSSYQEFKQNFQYYADVAWHVQREVERALIYLFRSRLKGEKPNLCYAGGVALNAVANKVIKNNDLVKNLYIAPAAGDNGISLGCAFYGWLEVIKKQRVMHSGSTCYGKPYSTEEIQSSIERFDNFYDDDNLDLRIRNYFEILPEFQEVFHDYDISWVFEVGGSYMSTLKLPGVKDVAKTQCRINIDKMHLSRAIVDPVYWYTLLDLDEIEVSDVEAFKIFLWFYDLRGLLKDKRLEKNVKPSSIKGFYRRSNDFISEAAKLLSEGKVIGWYQGGSEFGPRALGRRSILADPRVAGTRNFINTDIKFREDFRPFAPSVLAGDVSRYFKYGFDSPYMIMVDEIKKEWAKALSNIVHEDGSCRVQTVHRKWNPVYYELIKEFKRITGISVLLNTSFNRKGMPIVETPSDALSFFYDCKLDYLIMEDYIIGKSEVSSLPEKIDQKESV